MLNGISAVITGQIHINQGRECEDYTELDLERKDYVMTAVADGHSSQKHFRSDRGSQFAAEAAKESIYEYMNDYNRFVEAYNYDKQYLINRIIKMTISKWHIKINEDVDMNPITQNEIDKYLDNDFDIENISSIYDTTLSVGVMSQECSFGFLIGDGSFVVIDKNGKMNTPIDNIENRNYKKTLSDDEAYNNFTTYFSDEMPFAIMISTSGLYNSFIDKKNFLDYNYSIATELGSLNTIDDKINMEEKLGEQFEEKSKQGSQDDISMSIIFNSDNYDGIIKNLENMKKIQEIDNEINYSKEKIKIFELNNEQILSQKNENNENIEKLASEKQELEKLNIDLKEQKHLLEEQIKKIQEELSKITSQEEHIDSRKVEIDSLLEKYKTIDKEKEEELNKNIEDKRREEEHIKLKEEEKKYLQL